MDPISLSGAPGSPYTRKMLALLRYRRLPYRVLLPDRTGDLPRPKVALMPTFYLPGPDGKLEAVTDSTPILRRLEREAAGRHVVADTPALALLDALIEDYADEWLTKCMFHFRWSAPADIGKAAKLLPLTANMRLGDEALRAAGEAFAARQIGRLHVVGSNPATASIIEGSYLRFLKLFDGLLQEQAFLMGARPGASDFAVFGQLSQLTGFDPTPSSLALDTAPRVVAWTQAAEDLSGLEPQDGDWLAEDELLRLAPLLREIGRTYAPVMLANAQALQTGAARVHTEIDGAPWEQQPFPYQAKCLGWLRTAYAALPEPAAAQVRATLADTGCLELFTG